MIVVTIAFFGIIIINMFELIAASILETNSCEITTVTIFEMIIIEFGLVQYMLTIRPFWPPQRLLW